MKIVKTYWTIDNSFLTPVSHINIYQISEFYNYYKDCFYFQTI